MSDPASDPTGWLEGLEKTGWRFGLERIWLLTDLLGLPQNRYGSIHVVGSNGKSSVALIASALLREHGLATGTYLSPHLDRWTERIRIGGEEVGAEEFAAAAARTAEAIEPAERSLEPGDRVTQFEALTATAFVAFAKAGVQVAVVEAGLGGRLDATNVIPSRVTALTSISLEHTDYLGETIEEIAAEKLEVVGDHSTLVTGRLPVAAARLAAEAAAARSAALVDATAREPDVPASVRGAYQRRNFAVALAAAEAFAGAPFAAEAIERAAAGLRVPVRLEWVDGQPPVLLDAAHNPAGAEALAESLPELAGDRHVITVLASLADKPVLELCRPLAEASSLVICTEIPVESLAGAGRPGARAHTATELAGAVLAAGGSAEPIADPGRALERARELAAARNGLVLVAGSFYLHSALRG